MKTHAEKHLDRNITSNARPRTRSALSRRNIVFELSANNLSIQSQTATLLLVHFLQKSKKNFFCKKVVLCVKK